jgi:hypothetical protein
MQRGAKSLGTAWQGMPVHGVDRQRTHRTLALRMTAAAHFMQHVYSRFDAPLEIQPPR